jgi:excisionase family DNA binding protein
MNAPNLEPLFTRDEAAEYLGVCPHTLVRLEARGQGPARVRVGRLIRYRASDLREFLAANTIEPSGGTPEKAA